MSDDTSTQHATRRRWLLPTGALVVSVLGVAQSQGLLTADAFADHVQRARQALQLGNLRAAQEETQRAHALQVEGDSEAKTHLQTLEQELAFRHGVDAAKAERWIEAYTLLNPLRSYIREHQPDAAPLLQRVDTHYVDTLRSQAAEAHERGAYPRALELLRQAQQLDPRPEIAQQIAEARYAFALEHLRGGRPAQALVHFESIPNHRNAGAMAVEAADALIYPALSRIQAAIATRDLEAAEAAIAEAADLTATSRTIRQRHGPALERVLALYRELREAEH